MLRHAFTRFSAATILAVVFCGWLCPAAFAAPAAQIEILAVSPREVAASTTDIFDSTASGLRGVGTGQKTYLQAVPAAGAGIGGYQWAITTRPTGSTAALSSASNQTIFLRPDKAGDYTVTLTPLNASMQPTTPTTQLIMAGKWVGSGLINTHETPDPTIPQCGTSWCHGGENADPRLTVAPDWLLSKHANKLQAHMNGEQGTHYSTSCLSCHTLGFDTSTQADNSGFDEAARMVGKTVKETPPFKAVDNLESFGPSSSVAQAALAVDPEKTAPPVEWTRSFIVLKVLQKSPIDEADYRKKMPQLRDMLEAQKVQAYTAYWLEKTKSQSVIEDNRSKVD